MDHNQRKPKLTSGISTELFAGIFGLAIALLFGFMMAFNEYNPLRLKETGFGIGVLALIMATPYLAALFSLMLPAGSRWLVILPAAFLSVPAMFISLAGAGLLFLPGIALLFAAAGRSMGRSQMSRPSKIFGILATVMVVTTVVGAGLSMYQTDNPRSWGYIKYADGDTEWRSLPITPGRIGPVGILGPEAVQSGASYFPDIVTNAEAVTSAALLLLAWIEIGLLGVYAKKRWPDLPEQPLDTNSIPTLPSSS